MSADALTVGCKRNVKPDMAELKGKRLIIAAELEEGMRLNTSTVKQLCSTDEIEAEKKYKDPFKYVPTHTMIIARLVERIEINHDYEVEMLSYLWPTSPVGHLLQLVLPTEPCHLIRTF